MPRFSTLTGSSMLRVAGVVAALAVTIPLPGPATAAEIQPLRCGSRITGGPGIWQSMKGPVFDEPTGADVSQNIESFSVSPSNSQVIAVTNGHSIYVSQNGGCSWSFGADTSIVATGVFSTIKGVYVAANNTVFAIAEELNTGAMVGRPHVLRSANAGRGKWELADSGLPPIGSPLLLRGHRTKGNVLYLSFSGAREESAACLPAPVGCPAGSGEPLGLLYATTNGGGSWTSRTDPGDVDSVTAIKQFSIDDDDPNGNVIWLVAKGRLRKSTDGGRSYEAPDGLDQSGFTFTTVETLSNTKQSAGIKIVAFSAESEMIRLQNGKGWIRSKVPFSAVESVAQRPEGDMVVATTPATGVSLWRIYPKDFFDYDNKSGFGGKVFHTTFGWESVNPATRLPVSAFVNAGPAPAGAGTFYVRDNRRVLRFLGSTRRLENPPAKGVNLGAPPPPRGTLTPRNTTLTIKKGGSEKVRYTLTLPPAPTPIDIYLLVDNSGSMSPIIQALKDDLGSVVQRLYDTGVDVQVGVGQINVEPEKQSLPIDDPDTEYDESKPRPIYQVLRKIGPVNGDLYDALSKVDGNGGSGQEPQLEALWQSVMGKGMSFGNLGWLAGYSIPPDHDAEFRDPLDPIKVIVHATDEAFGRTIGCVKVNEEPKPGCQSNAHNDFEEVAATLRTAGVKQIGLSQSNDLAGADLERMARLTGAVAPRGGTDCDGDGRIGPDDVRAGRPLVCGQSHGLSDTLVNLIRSLNDRQSISVHARPAPNIHGGLAIDYDIDAKQPTTRTFTVTYSCKGMASGEYANSITAALRGITIAKAAATVTCEGTDPPQQQPPVFEEPAFNPPQPQPQPMVPAPAPVNPVPQPQTQVQTQTQVNPQAGMADQEQEQLQLAVADNTLAPRDEDQLAMSAMSYADNPEVVLAFGMAMATAAGLGFSLRRRSRTATAKVTLRR